MGKKLWCLPWLSDEEVADVMNYVMNSWSNKQTKMVTVSEVALKSKTYYKRTFKKDN
jgi:mono/diheme cytochrome c family protein